MTVSKPTTFSAPKGIPDYFPPNSAEFVAVREGLLGAARAAGYGHIELPIFEDTGLFARESANRPTWSARRCTPSPIAATDR